MAKTIGSPLLARLHHLGLHHTYSTSMGFSVPAALGAGLADPSKRPIVLVGDGAFQMTGTELATCRRHGQTPIVLVLNNHGYSTEREIMDGPFNNLHEWQYHNVCELLGGGVGCHIQTYRELVETLKTALADTTHLYVLNVELDPTEHSIAMKRVARRLAKRVGSERE